MVLISGRGNKGTEERMEEQTEEWTGEQTEEWTEEGKNELIVAKKWDL